MLGSTPSAQHPLPILLLHITCLNHSPSEQGPVWEGADTRREKGRMDAVSMVQKTAQRHLLFCPSFSPCLPSRSGASLLPPLPRHGGLLKVWDIRPADPPHTEGVGTLQQSLPKDHFQGAHGHLRVFSAPSPVSYTLWQKSSQEAITFSHYREIKASCAHRLQITHLITSSSNNRCSASEVPTPQHPLDKPRCHVTGTGDSGMSGWGGETPSFVPLQLFPKGLHQKM